MEWTGKMLYGYCEGYFGRDSFSDKIIEATGEDWAVARQTDGVAVVMARFKDREDLEKQLGRFSKEPDEYGGYEPYTRRG